MIIKILIYYSQGVPLTPGLYEGHVAELAAGPHRTAADDPRVPGTSGRGAAVCE